MSIPLMDRNARRRSEDEIPQTRASSPLAMRKRSSKAKINRLFKLIALLDSAGSQHKTASTLGEMLGVTRRQVFRDLAMLRELGVECADVSDSPRNPVPRVRRHASELTAPETRAVIYGLWLIEAGLCGPNSAAVVGLAHCKLAPLFHRRTATRLQRSVARLDSSLKSSRMGEIVQVALDGMSLGHPVRVRLDSELRSGQFRLDCETISFTVQGWALVGRSSWHRCHVSVPVHSISRIEIIRSESLKAGDGHRHRKVLDLARPN